MDKWMELALCWFVDDVLLNVHHHHIIRSIFIAWHYYGTYNPRLEVRERHCIWIQIMEDLSFKNGAGPRLLDAPLVFLEYSDQFYWGMI